MSSASEYYRVNRKGDDTIPLLGQDKGCPSYLYRLKPVTNPELLLFRLNQPIPRKPRMADYHSSPQSIVSKKIFDVLSPLNIEGIQLLPARIRGKNDEIFENYWAIHIYNSMQCVDMSQSDCVADGTTLGEVKKLVLDKKALDAIPLQKRLIFRLKEDFSFQLFHKSIVDAITAVNPDGIRFTEIEKWTEASYFDN